MEHLSVAKAQPVLVLWGRVNSATFLPGWLKAGSGRAVPAVCQPLYSAAPALWLAFPVKAVAASCALPCSRSS